MLWIINNQLARSPSNLLRLWPGAAWDSAASLHIQEQFPRIAQDTSIPIYGHFLEQNFCFAYPLLFYIFSLVSPEAIIETTRLTQSVENSFAQMIRLFWRQFDAREYRSSELVNCHATGKVTILSCPACSVSASRVFQQNIDHSLLWARKASKSLPIQTYSVTRCIRTPP